MSDVPTHYVDVTSLTIDLPKVKDLLNARRAKDFRRAIETLEMYADPDTIIEPDEDVEREIQDAAEAILELGPTGKKTKEYAVAALIVHKVITTNAEVMNALCVLRDFLLNPTWLQEHLGTLSPYFGSVEDAAGWAVQQVEFTAVNDGKRESTKTLDEIVKLPTNEAIAKELDMVDLITQIGDLDALAREGK